MKKICILLIFVSSIGVLAQNAVHNFGNIRLHTGASVGFHTDLTNDGNITKSKGLAGFYSDNGSILISGTFSPQFFDIETATVDGLVLEIPLFVENNANFISGNIITDKSFTNRYLGFTENGFYTGQNATAKVDGYTAITAQSKFTFPVGLEGRLRPLIISSTDLNVLAKCAYFFEDPNTPSTTSVSYDTESKEEEIVTISTLEYWKLEGSLPSNITIGWDAFSETSSLTGDINDLIVVGWDRDKKIWVNLGNIQTEGDFTFGAITSEQFIPNEYTALTFGSLSKGSVSLDVANYMLSPNNDGINDALVIKGVEDSPNNLLSIYNRHGGLVFEKENYSNEFVGFANSGIVFDKNASLPSGVYFYVIELKDLNKTHQGYLHLTAVE